MARHARELVKDLIDFLDQLEADPDLEPTAGGSCDDECELPGDDEYSGDEHEPSLGAVHSLDQFHAWKGRTDDLELDHAESGIGDCDGLLEQVGTQDWQQGAMG